jgi:hypothetical protein
MKTPPDNRKWHCLEFSVAMNCVNRCPYCPQELILSKYKGKMVMTLEDFKKILEHVPKEVRLRYAGFSEPFQNPEFSDMLVYADKLGYKQVVYTTMVEFKDSDYEKIKDIDFEFFHVHDVSEHNNRQEDKKKWLEKGFIDEWVKAKPNNRANNMGEEKGFTPNPYRENVVGCSHTVGYHLNTVMPNGDVVLCCADWGLTNILGNLYEVGYYDLKRPTEPVELCHYCNYAL